MQIWKYQDVPPTLKGFQDFVFTPMSVSDTDNHIPKLYSSAKNMDAGPVPQLQVRLFIVILKVYINFQGLTLVEEMLIQQCCPLCLCIIFLMDSIVTVLLLQY